MTNFTAKRTPRFASPAAWRELLKPEPAGPPLEGNHTADFVIVGAGFAGLSAARRLKQLQPAARVMVLDALAIAEGTAGRNSGFMIDLPHDLASDDYAGQGTQSDQLLTQLNRQAIGFALDAVAEYKIDPAFADPCGKVNGAASAAGHAHNESYAAHLRSLSETSEILDAQGMKDLTGSEYYLSGLFTPGTLLLQPAGYILGFAQGLRKEGVGIYENSPVLNFSKVGSDWRVKTPNAAITTPHVILANNGHLESFGIAKGRLVQLFLYASMTGELGSDQLNKLGGQPRWGITPSDPMGTTMRRIDTAQGGNRIVTRTCATVRTSMEASQSDVARAARVQRKKFAARFPKLADMPMEYEWAGHLCLSLNGTSVTGPIEDGVISACVQNGLGTARGTLTGIAAAEMACGHRSDITTFFNAEAEPKKLPPQPFAQIGANAYLRWKEYKAGAE